MNFEESKEFLELIDASPLFARPRPKLNLRRINMSDSLIEHLDCAQPTIEKICQELAESNDLAHLVRELFKMLDQEEESMEQRRFHPTYINSCRTIHCMKLDAILPRMKELANVELANSGEGHGPRGL